MKNCVVWKDGLQQSICVSYNKRQWKEIFASDRNPWKPTVVDSVTEKSITADWNHKIFSKTDLKKSESLCKESLIDWSCRKTIHTLSHALRRVCEQNFMASKVTGCHPLDFFFWNLRKKKYTNGRQSHSYHWKGRIWNKIRRVQRGSFAQGNFTVLKVSMSSYCEQWWSHQTFIPIIWPFMVLDRITYFHMKFSSAIRYLLW